jgi:hypothetical protein
MVEETFEPGMTVSLVARRHGVAPNQLFTWRRLAAQGSLTAAGSGEEVVPASAEPSSRTSSAPGQRWTRRFSKRPSKHATGQKTTAAAAVAAEGRLPMKTVAEGQSTQSPPYGCEGRSSKSAMADPVAIAMPV